MPWEGVIREKQKETQPLKIKPLLSSIMPKGGFEPPRVSPLPPQDSVSATSTTSALILFRPRSLGGRRGCWRWFRTFFLPFVRRRSLRNILGSFFFLCGLRFHDGLSPLFGRDVSKREGSNHKNNGHCSG